MKTIITALLIVAVVAGAAGIALAQAPPRAAFIYCAWKDNRHEKEWDEILDALGFAVDKYENTRVAQLTNRLADYDLVFTSTVFNIENTVDLGAHAEAFTDFVSGGGILMFTDANYAHTLDQGLSALSEDFATGFALARALRDPTPENRELHPGPHPLLARVPNDLLPLMETAQHWAHLLPRSETWKPVVLDVDEQPVMMYQECGEGLVIAHSYFGFRRSAVKPLGVPLLENILLYRHALRAGLQVTRLDWGTADPGANEVLLALRRHPRGAPGPLRARLAVQFADHEPVIHDRTLEIPAEGEVSLALPYTVDRRGPLRLSLELVRDDDIERAIRQTHEVVVPEVLTAFSWKRHAYAPDNPLTIELQLAPDPDFDHAAHRLEVVGRVGEATGRPVILPAESGRFPLPVDDLPPGDGTVTLRLVRADAEVARAELPLSVTPEPHVRIRPDGATLVGGEPFFPMGMYTVPHRLEDRERLFAMMQEIADGGFNVVYTAVRTEKEFERTLAEAQRLGVMMMYGGGTRPGWREKHSANPHILAWCTIDEPDAHGMAPEDVARASARILDQDPNRPTYVTLCQPPSYALYCRTGDIIAPDPYPVGRALPLSYVSRCMASLQELLQGDRPLWGVPQAFGGYGSWEVPTPEQSRNMTYQFLVHGARGLIFYTYWDSSFDMRDHPDLWEELKRQTTQVQALAPMLLSPAEGVVRRQGPAEVVQTLWKPHDDERYLIAVNAGEDDLGVVELNVPFEGAGTLRGVFDDAQAPVADGRVRLPMPPLAVCVMRLEPADG